MRHNIGNSIDDLKDNYPIDLIYALYDKCIYKEYDEYWMNAVTFKNAMDSVVGYGDDSKSSRKKSKNWSKFMDNLDLRTKRKKSEEKRTVKGFVGMISMAGIPVVDKSKK